MWLQYNFHIWNLGFSQGYIWILGFASDLEMSQSQSQHLKFSDTLKPGFSPVFKNTGFNSKV